MTQSININGVMIEPSTDIASLLRDEFRGAARFARRYDEGPEPGVRTFVDEAKGTPVEGRVSDALLALLVDPEGAVRAGAVAMVLHFAELFDPSRLLDVLENNKPLFENAPLAGKTTSGLDQAWALRRAMAATPTRDTRVLEALRHALRDPRGSWILAGLTSNDSDWVIGHPQEAVDDNVERARVIMLRLNDANLRERFVRAIPAESPKLRGVVADAVSSEVRDREERDRLIHLLT